MKFLVLALVAVTGISAASTTVTPGGNKDCDADYIVRQCLLTENDKLTACGPADYQCQCYAYQAIATCYNNCPNDIRAPSATQAMNSACLNASLYATTTKAKATASKDPSTSTTAESPSPTDAPTGSLTTSADPPTKTNGGDSLAGNAIGVLAAVAGAVAVVL